MVFSLVLLAPSWGGMINGVMTLSGAWHKLRDDPILKFLIVSLSFYGMSTFEGPMMSIKTVNALSHYTDWTVGHVHSGALGWVGLISMGTLYYMVPRMFGRTKMYSVPAIELHFWIATLGIVLYIAAMWMAGVMQGLMWRDVNADGTLVYSFVESVKATFPFYVIRLCGGLLYLGGHAADGVERRHDGASRARARSARFRSRRSPAPRPRETPGEHMSDHHAAPVSGHEKIETNNLLMIVLILLVVAVGGIVEIVPLFFQRSTTEAVPGLKPLTALQLAGRDIYTREGCYNCHSQMIRVAARRDAALRPRLDGRRVRLRPPVPVGQQAHRPRPAPRRRQVQRRVASAAPEQPARPGPRVEHAGLPVADDRRGRRRDDRRPHDRPAPGRRALQRPGDRRGARRAFAGKSEIDALVAYLQVLGTSVK